MPLTAREGKGPDSSMDSGNVIAHTLRSEGHDASEDGTGRGVPLVLTQNGSDVQVNRDRTGAITGGIARGTSGPIAFSGKDHGADAGEIAPTLRAMPHHESHPNGGGQVAVAFSPLQGGRSMPVGDTTPTLEAGTGNKAPAVAFNWQNGGGYGDANPGLGITEDGTGPLGTSQIMGVAHAAIPRRLTPRECERLQGFPDDWTLYGVTDEGKRVKLSDSARYRQMGNAVTVNVAEWLGRRLANAG